MEKIMTNGFCELNEQEMMETEGGWTWPWEAAKEAKEAKARADQAAYNYYYNSQYANTSTWDYVAPTLRDTTPSIKN